MIGIAVAGPRTALVFPGLDALQRPREHGGLLELTAVRSHVRRAVRALGAADRIAGGRLAEVVAAVRDGDREAAYTPAHAAVTAAAVVAIQAGIARHLVRRLGAGEILALAGYSLGEVSRSVVAGVGTLEDAVRLAALDAALGDHAGRGGSALLLGRAALAANAGLEQLPAQGVQVCRLSDRAAHLAGSHAGLRQAARLAARHGWRLCPSLAIPIHSPLLMRAAVAVRRALRRLPLRAPRFALYSGRTGGGRLEDVAAIAEDHARCLVEPFHWPGAVAALRRAGVERVVNVGPSLTLGRVCRELAPDIDVVDAHALA